MMYFTAILVFAAASVASTELSTQFGSMVFHLTNRHPNDYNHYGCWCGTNASTINYNNTLDETDSCCKTQAECYEHVQATNSSCIKNGKYHAVYYDDQVQCVDNDGTSNYDLCKCDKQAAECFKRSLPTFDSNNSNISLSAVCQPETTTNSPIGNKFAMSQVVDEKTVTCDAVNNSNSAYTECSDLKQGGLYFPNGISCSAFWNSTNSVYSDTLGFCRRLTGSPTATMFAYYVCSTAQPRAVWKNNTWSTVQDNGYTQHVRCYY